VTEISNDRLHLALTAPAARLALALGVQAAAGLGGGASRDPLAGSAPGPASPARSPDASAASSPTLRSPARRARSRGGRCGAGAGASTGVPVMRDVQEDAFRWCGLMQCVGPVCSSILLTGLSAEVAQHGGVHRAGRYLLMPAACACKRAPT